VSTIEVSGLRVEVARTGAEIVDGIAFAAAKGEIVGLVGESGSGKTTAAVALLGHARRGTRIVAGTVSVAGVSILDLVPEQLREARGKLVAYVPQDPAAALNPALRIGLQLQELLDAHGAGGSGERITEALAEVALPADEAFLRRYPHQLSGGQQQRICLAMAFLLRPAAIVLDEPTTGLDVTTQAHVLETVRDLCRSHDTAAVYVSHDLAAVAAIASRVVVLYAGRVVEDGAAERLFVRPGHPYTRKLALAIPDVAERRRLEAIPGLVPAPGARGDGCVFAARCEHTVDVCLEGPPPPVEIEPGHLVRCVRVRELDQGLIAVGLPPRPEVAVEAPLLEVRSVDAFHGSHQVLHGVSLALGRSECLALVGESGSGKTTLARVIAGLHTNRTGEVLLDGCALEPGARQRPAEACRRLQYVFQSPYNALNPRRTIGEILGVPLGHFHGLRGAAAEARAAELLDQVALPPQLLHRDPGELSGGERQRVAIARALAANPDVIVCDEITSALDASVQAAIVELLEELREREDVSLLFVTHNLALVRTIADRVAVLDRGRVVEAGRAARVLDAPEADYTRRLLADTPTLGVPAA
jgi:peptide/nickel transport system ATP-binding protein